jgi:hypothetical protein
MYQIALKMLLGDRANMLDPADRLGLFNLVDYSAGLDFLRPNAVDKRAPF